MRNRVVGFAQRFGAEFIRRRTQRKIAEGFIHRGNPVPGINFVLEKFTPDGLEHLIKSGGSIIDPWLRLVPDELKTVALFDLKEVDIDVPTMAKSINWDQVMDVVAKTLPKHAEVVRRHPRWYAGETKRAVDTFLRVAPYHVAY
ncbi:MAG: hypothetical protein ABIH46_05640 [Chloroflexota bacterium]